VEEKSLVDHTCCAGYLGDGGWQPVSMMVAFSLAEQTIAEQGWREYEIQAPR